MNDMAIQVATQDITIAIRNASLLLTTAILVGAAIIGVGQAMK